MDLISQYEAAKRSGVSKPGILKAVRTGRIPLTQGKIDADSDEWKNYMASHAGVESRQNGDDGEDDEHIELSKYKLEIRKLEAQTKKLAVDTRLANIRADAMRGRLRDARFTDMAMVELMTSAFEQFDGVVSVLDGIIADAMSDGFESRAKSEQKILDKIDKIKSSIEQRWRNQLKKWANEVVQKRNFIDEQ